MVLLLKFSCMLSVSSYLWSVVIEGSDDFKLDLS